MYLKELIKVLLVNVEVKNHYVNNICDNSKIIEDNDIFVAINGYRVDGHDYIEDAIKRGAKTIIYQTKIKFYEGINYIKTNDTKKALALLLKKRYEKELKKVKIIGVTGTQGKTTTSTLISEALSYKGIKNILIGTNGIKYDKEYYKTNNTTPSINIIYECIKRCNKEKIKYIIMEVSSQAIKELRCYYLDYEIGVYTNLSKEHLDYHKTMDDYFYTKLLFLKSVKKDIVINKDDKYYNLINKYIDKSIITYSLKTNSLIKGNNINKTLDKGTNFKIVYKNTKYEAKTYLLGDFNIYNILAAFGALSSFYDINEFLSFLKIYNSVDGRMNTYNYKGLTFLIDYAHTADGVWNVLRNIKDYTLKRIILIVGCGGNRDESKRSEIGRISTTMADYVIFTNDNPRFEDEKKIIKDILSGVRNDNYEVIYNRYEAIKRAIEISTNKEVIVILGKGNEEYQLINNIKYPFNDLSCVKEILEEKK